MPKTSIKSPRPALAVLLTLLLAAFGLAACGGSSSSSTTTSTTAAASKQAAGRSAGRFTALRACLQKNGITLPQPSGRAGRRPGGRAGGLLGGGGAGVGGPQLPKGVTRKQLQAAMSKCGGAGGFGRSPRANNPAFKQALTKFATCMRQHGVKLPAPNTAGGAVFSTKGLNTRSKSFMAAATACQPLLHGSFGGGPPGRGGASS